jgi:serine/threonine-protein kinase
LGDLDIWTVSIEAVGGELKAGKPEPFIQTPAHERDAAFSPDGRWLAYISTESGAYEVYVRAFPGSSTAASTKWQLSNGGGFNPVWARNSRQLFYRSPQNRVILVDYKTAQDSFIPEKPRIWADTQVYNGGMMPTFDVSPDGKRIAVVRTIEDPKPQTKRHNVTLVTNWTSTLKK